MAPRSSRVLLVLALGALASAGGSALAPAPAVLADDVDDQLAALREAVKANDEAKALETVTKLETNLDGRVTEAFADITRTTKSDRIFKATLKLAANRKHEGLLKWMNSKLGDFKDMAEDKPERLYAILDAVPPYGDLAAVTQKNTEKIVDKFLSTKADIAKRGVLAYGAVRTKPTVERLVEWMVQTETKGGGGQGGGGGGKSMSEETKKNYGEVNPVIGKALTNLTNQEMATAADWQKWWDENKKTFKFPEPAEQEKAQAEPDWPNLQEYVDRMGVTLKKPGYGKFWAFLPPQEDDKKLGQRAKLAYRDNSGVIWANCNVWSMKKFPDIGTLDQFAARFEKQWGEGVDGRPAEFSEFSKSGGAPKHEARKISGRDFYVISAKGLAHKDSGFKDWDSCERRIYVFMPNPNSFFYLEAIIRNGAEDELKKSFWDTIEGVQIKK